MKGRKYESLKGPNEIRISDKLEREGKVGITNTWKMPKSEGNLEEK